MNVPLKVNITQEELSVWARVNGFVPWVLCDRLWAVRAEGGGTESVESQVELVSFPFVDSDGHAKVMARMVPDDPTTMVKIPASELLRPSRVQREPRELSRRALYLLQPHPFLIIEVVDDVRLRVFFDAGWAFTDSLAAVEKALHVRTEVTELAAGDFLVKFIPLEAK